jgi:succinyl-diaminopimelate desuccinylase
MLEKIDKEIDELIPEMVEEISQAVRIPSFQAPAEPNAPFGSEAVRVLAFLLESGRKKGFTVKNTDNYAGHIEYGHTGNLYAALGHLDVVPVENKGEGWSVPPFGGIVKDGYVWGRGSSDDKGPTFAVLYALYALKRLAVSPENRIRIILGTNEETDWECVHHYFKKEPYPDFAIAADSLFPGVYAEKGILRVDLFLKAKEDASSEPNVTHRIRIEGGTTPNVVPKQTRLTVRTLLPALIREMAQQFRPQNKVKVSWIRTSEDCFELTFIGKSFHAAHPDEGINSIAACLDFCRILSLPQSLKSGLNCLWERIGYDFTGKSTGISGIDGASGALTMNLGKIESDGLSLKATLDIRYPIFFRKDRILQQLSEAFSEFEVREHASLDPLYVSPENAYMKQLVRIYNDFTGEDLSPKSMGGGTYARAVPCGICYGPLFPGEESYAHQIDERKSIVQLTKACKIYARLFYEWLTTKKPE